MLKHTEVDSKTDEALAALDSLYDKLKEQILRNYTNFNKSFIKVEDMYKKWMWAKTAHHLVFVVKRI